MISLLLIASVFLVFGRALSNDFVNYDDDDYVTANPHVRQGLTPDSAAWAMTTGYFSYWHPLTWLSHMLDCQIYGMRAWGHHLTSLLIHAANAVLLFWVLFRMTGGLWPSAFVAAVFAIHPLRAESVVWVSERKDVLSALFWLLTMLAYARYAERPSSRSRYSMVALAFALGLLAKPMLVTLPFALLLLDYWPLRRFVLPPARKSSADPPAWPAFGRLVIEKIPLFVLAAACSVTTFLVQRYNGTVSTLGAVSLAARIGNALVAYAGYLGKVFFPVRLAVLYPCPAAGRPIGQVLGAVALLAAISAVAALNARKRPYLLIGWLWFLGTLVPVIGIVQVGSQAMADRYTYLTTAGLAMAIAWTGEELVRKRPRFRAPVAGAAGLCLAVLGALAWVQTGYWRNSETLFRHELRVAPPNSVAHNNLGSALFGQGRFEEALFHYGEALRFDPSNASAIRNYGMALVKLNRMEEAIAYCSRVLPATPGMASARNQLGLALERLGRADAAIFQYSEAVRIDPAFAEAQLNLGVALGKKGQIDSAVQHCAEAARLSPGNPEAHFNLGLALGMMGRADEAAVQYSETLRLAPAHSGAHTNLGAILEERGQIGEAIEHYRAVLRQEPGSAAAHVNLAAALAKQGNTDEALEQCSETARLQPADPRIRFELGQALSRLGKTPQAAEQYRQALSRAEATSDTQLAAQIQDRLTTRTDF